ncbi:uncharacterized protein LOC129612019 [Condylostylus longicornis]|uniref:uncharacterized protein LOC129612019 n=1 Tax=Condylostylus longicornis TaxID=2530218 RepID=UPI00244E3C3C|nr:uncharacterized protein LOC129612019 [Condylostylus longicornis]
MNTDPWRINKEPNKTINSLSSNSLSLEFEDNFTPSEEFQIECTNILPDSKKYLESLEKKLKKLRSDPRILEQLAQKREECLNNLINNSLNLDSNVEFDTPIGGDSAVYDIYRHLYPTQPITIGETVHILKYDQLQEEKNADIDVENSSETASR